MGAAAKAILLLASFSALAAGSVVPKKVGYGPGEQDWGWIDVRTGSHMFYWLFYTTADVESYTNRPLVIWLQGGPGASSSGYGNFAELGPLHINGTERQYAWTKNVNLMFIDNPVGAGFSYVDNSNFLVRNNIQIGTDMVAFLREFYTKYPNFRPVPMYIFCESYGGKMAVEIAKQLNDAIKQGKVDANFKGVALGDSWISPIDSVMTWGPLLLNTGLVDQRSYARIMKGADDVKRALDSGQYEKATDLWAYLERVIMKETNNVDFYNILYKVKPIYMTHASHDILDLNYPIEGQSELDDVEVIDRLMNGPVRRALKIPDNIVHSKQRPLVFEALKGDFMKPVMHVVEHLLNNTNIDVAVFSGQLDLIVDTYGTLAWVDKLRWKGRSTWQGARRQPIVLNGVIEGYLTEALNLRFYWINRAGHMVPTDNPETAMEMLRRITHYDSM